MRKLVFALLLLCSALFATAQEWQWSVQLKGFISSETGKEPTAFLWIPSDCHQLRAVMVGKHNMSEETLFEMPRFREAHISFPHRMEAPIPPRRYRGNLSGSLPAQNRESQKTFFLPSGYMTSATGSQQLS